MEAEVTSSSVLFGQYYISQGTYFLICLVMTILVTMFAAFIRCGRGDTPKEIPKSIRRRMVFASFFIGMIQNCCVLAYARADFPLITVHGYLVLQILVMLHMSSMVYGRLRGIAWRIIVTVPASAFVSSCVWSIFILPGWIYGPKTWLWFLFPWILSLIGIYHSQTNSEGTTDLHLSGTSCKRLMMLTEDVPHGAERAVPFTFFQITDPHLGPFMSVDRLRGICERAVAAKPHLIFLTGDFFTLESHMEPNALTRALEPLKAYKGKVFACLGNHDHEVRDKTEDELAAVGVELLVEKEKCVETPAGKIQIVAADFTFPQGERRGNLINLTQQYKRKPDHLRVLLIHDPLVFKHVPDYEADLVLSGHTHGGQVGCRTRWGTCSVFAVLTNICRIPLPGIGFWGNGVNRLYVHPGTGFYGFPLRVGIRGHEGVVRVHYADDLLTTGHHAQEKRLDLSESSSLMDN